MMDRTLTWTFSGEKKLQLSLIVFTAQVTMWSYTNWNVAKVVIVHYLLINKINNWSLVAQTRTKKRFHPRYLCSLWIRSNFLPLLQATISDVPTLMNNEHRSPTKILELKNGDQWPLCKCFGHVFFLHLWSKHNAWIKHNASLDTSWVMG